VLNWYHSQVNSSVLPNNETLIANVNSNVNPLIDRIRTLIPENMNTVKLFVRHLLQPLVSGSVICISR
jgi:hypothetical protein